MKRLLWLLLGGLALLLGAVGAVTPLLPTAPFILLAAFAFARGHPPLEAYLLHHPRFGRAIADWRRTRRIPRAGKIAMLAMMSLSAALLFWRLPWPLAGSMALLMAALAWYLCRCY